MVYTNFSEESSSSLIILNKIRNTSEKRKSEILTDLQLPLNHPEKILKAVVATVSLGVGVDVRVQNVVSLSLWSTPEDTVQEAGRCMRGKPDDTAGSRGLAFFFQKGCIAAIHCPPQSDCRTLISDPLPMCQTELLFKFFDPNFLPTLAPCECCYSCICRDATQGCSKCIEFLGLYLPKRNPKFSSRSVARELSLAIKELFQGLGISKIKVESRLEMSVQNFTSDLIKCFDEVTDPSDIVKLWHVSDSLATDLYSVCQEVMKFEPAEEEASVHDSYEDGDELSLSEESFVSLSNDGPDTSLSSEEL